MTVRSIKNACCVLVFAGLTPSVASAVTGDEVIGKILNTSALYADGSKTYHGCFISNVTTANLLVKVDLLDRFGNTLATTGATLTTLPAGQTLETTLGLNSTYSGSARCRFTIPSGAADAVRANVAVFYYNPTGAFYQTLGVSEAR